MYFLRKKWRFEALGGVAGFEGLSVLVVESVLRSGVESMLSMWREDDERL